jgi:hypothetical protein
MRLNRKSAVGLGAIVVALLGSFLLWPLLMPISDVGPAPDFGVSVYPTTPDSPMYTSVGQNWTLTYQAQWLYGIHAGQAIKNATVTIQVNSTTNQNKPIDLKLNTTSGVFSFNYSSLTADILTFNVTKLVTEEVTEYNANAFDLETGSGGLQSRVVTVWWDKFHVALLESDTASLGAMAVLVNVTYQLLPEEGLTLPAWATYSHQTFLPKIVHGQHVIINGVPARETETAGIYTASSASWFPTTYVHVAIAQENWTTTYTGFSFVHNTNALIWDYAIAATGALVIAAVSVRFIMFRKAKGTDFFKRSNFPFFAGILLALASAISLYWGIVGIDSTLQGFNWMLLAALGIVSCGVGLAGAIMSLKNKNHAFVIFSVIVPLITNFVVVKAELGMYQLATPWITLIVAFAASLLSGLLICNADDHAAPRSSKKKPTES